MASRSPLLGRPIPLRAMADTLGVFALTKTEARRGPPRSAQSRLCMIRHYIEPFGIYKDTCAAIPHSVVSYRGKARNR